MVDIAKAQVAFAQAICDRLRRKPGPMLDATKPLFFRRRNKLAVLHNAGRTVRVERIEPENDHRRPALAAVRARSSPPGRVSHRGGSGPLAIASAGSASRRIRRSVISSASNVSANSRCNA